MSVGLSPCCSTSVPMLALNFCIWRSEIHSQKYTLRNRAHQLNFFIPWFIPQMAKLVRAELTCVWELLAPRIPSRSPALVVRTQLLESPIICCPLGALVGVDQRTARSEINTLRWDAYATVAGFTHCSTVPVLSICIRCFSLILNYLNFLCILIILLMRHMVWKYLQFFMSSAHSV